MNVEFFHSSIGERRFGCSAFDITGSGLADEDVIAFLGEWFPDDDIAHPEIWALGVTVGVSTTLTKRAPAGPSWSTVVPVDPIDTTAPDVYGMNTQILNAKQFFAYRSNVDRLHLWDGDTLRRAGLAEPTAPPVVTDTGSGSFADDRYYRIRYVKLSGSGEVLVRSEPSEEVTFEPSGSGSGASITRPVLLGESETHWEVEASSDDENWYRIATVLDSTTTYTDETDLTTDSYADVGTLSEDIGSYLLLPSAKYLTIDDDRLVFAGHWTDSTKKSLVGWTPVKNDPGKGNDERLPLDFDNTVELDTTDESEITGLSASTNGTWYAFKWGHIYKFTRLYTGALRAYQVFNLSKSHGAISGSIVSGADENGRSCIYFLDPAVGPMRLGAAGLQRVLGLSTTWKRVNATASIAARALYYSDKCQVHWWVAADGEDTPSLKIILQTDEIQSEGRGASRGFSLADGRIAEAYAATTIHELILNDEGNQAISNRPFIGLPTPNCIQRCDIENTDDGQAYVARIRTKAFFQAGLLNQWGAMAGALLADANASASVRVALIGDFGRYTADTKAITTSLAPVGTEEFVIKKFDDLSLSEATGIQIEFSDVGV
jgi:hypothetical protein